MNLCEFAKRGHLCPDDLCHGSPDSTLCGFDLSFYEGLFAESEDEEEEDWE